MTEKYNENNDHSVSHSLETRLRNMLSRSLRVCSHIPRATFGDFEVAEAKQAPITAQKIQEHCRHYLRLITQRVNHPLSNQM